MSGSLNLSERSIAALTGATGPMQKLITAGLDVNDVTRTGRYTVLHLAARGGRAAMVKMLLDAGAKVNAKDCSGCTPLHWAALEGRVAVVKMLLDAGADPSLKDEGGETALDEARIGKNRETVELLERYGAEKRMQAVAAGATNLTEEGESCSALVLGKPLKGAEVGAAAGACEPSATP